VVRKENLKLAIKIILTLLFLYSCSSTRFDNTSYVLKRASKKFIKEGHYNNYNVFEIKKFSILNDHYVMIRPELDKISVYEHHKIGDLVEVPSSFIETSNKLFLIYSNEDHNNKKVLDKIYRYKYLDSTLINAKIKGEKIKLTDRPVVTFNHSIQPIYYQIINKGERKVTLIKLQQKPR